GGVSGGAYASFNVGTRTGDDTAAVAENRARLQQLLPAAPLWLTQVHGSRVVTAESAGALCEADACVATEARRVCAIMVADCVPVLFTDVKGSVVAAAHAGWRGLAGGVIRNTVSALNAAGAPSGELLAYVGPGIGPRAFEVGPDVLAAFTAENPEAAAAFVPVTEGKWLADLFTLVRQALLRAGVKNIHGGGLCTYSDPARFYSYRRDRTTGRMAALIWRETR
ncbi:MAG TPA: peptidoglycan editing factor PgeF, partial [Opitutaceae bacterium]|nr:peptidoglycan editing factor PgeF [Opitutaceae bacterium]